VSDGGFASRGRAGGYEVGRTHETRGGRDADPERLRAELEPLVQRIQEDVAQVEPTIVIVETAPRRRDYERGKEQARAAMSALRRELQRAAGIAEHVREARALVEPVQRAVNAAATRLHEASTRRDAAIARWQAAQPVVGFGRLVYHDRMPDVDEEPAAPLPAEVRSAVEAETGGDLGAARVHTGPAAQAAADEQGAHAFTIGDDIVVGAGHDPEAPASFELMAHEAAHVVQQRGVEARVQKKAKDGGAPSHDEAAADRVAAAASGDLVDADAYLAANKPELGAAIRAYLRTHAPPAPHPTFLLDPDMFRMRFGVAFDAGDRVETLRACLAPERLADLVDRNRAVTDGARGPRAWSDSVGIAIGSRLVEALTASLARMIPRYAAVADERAADETPAPITADDLVPSHPLDRYTSRALCDAGVLERIMMFGPPRPSRDGGVHNQRRKVTGAWKAGALANWFRVETPADATAEEVAAHVLGDPALAYRLTCSPPLFGVPEDLVVRQFASVVEAPAEQPAAEVAIALANAGTDTDAAALAQADRLARPGKDAPRVDTAVLADMDISRLRLEALIDRLAPYGIAPLCVGAVQWLVNKRVQIDTGTADVLTWEQHAREQRRVLGEIVGDVEG
jgi:hypothetical protein